MKNRLLNILSVVFFATLVSSCGNDSVDSGSGGSIDAAVGTYKGKIDLMYIHEPNVQTVWYDAILIVTKEGNNKLKVTAKANEPYSEVTPKVFTVEAGAFFGTNTKDVASLSGSLEGYFHFTGSNKNVSIATDKQSETDKDYVFEGTKQ